MKYFVYIIYSVSLDKYYVGHTCDLHDRLSRHVNSGSKSTKTASDWKLCYYETFSTRGEAMERERIIKQKKSRKYLEWLIGDS